MTRASTPAVLITIPLSHYCEKARWALDRAGLPYREKPHVPLLHLLATKRKTGGSVPVLIHAGRRFIDSTAILVHADCVCGGARLYPQDATLRREVDSLVKEFDTDLGPATRRWVYAQLLPQPKLLHTLWARRVPRLEAGLLPLIVPLGRRLVRAAYKITPESTQRSLERIRGVFRHVDELLSNGRSFLVGERFTAADLTFAALSAPALFPAEYQAAHPALDSVPSAMREEVLRLRDTDAGRFALRLFTKERGDKSG